MMDHALAARAGIVVLCCAGLYISYVMSDKHVRAQRGELGEPSVVMSPRATLARVPNARIGFAYYALLLVLAPVLTPQHPLAVHAALGAATVAALASLYLGYSLLFVTRMPCVFCWTGHAINWSLLALAIAIERSLR
jgi:uncharacterized membrane protein